MRNLFQLTAPADAQRPGNQPDDLVHRALTRRHHADPAAKLVTGDTRSLGVAISLVANPYFAELIRVIENEADVELAAMRALRARRVDGLLLARIAEPDRPARTVLLRTQLIHRHSCGC